MDLEIHLAGSIIMKNPLVTLEMCGPAFDTD